MSPEQQLHAGGRANRMQLTVQGSVVVVVLCREEQSSLDGGDRHLIRLFLALPPLQQPLAISLSSLWRLQHREEEKDWEMQCRWGQFGDEGRKKRSNRWNKELATQKNKRGKLDNDNSNNSLDLPGDLILEASSLSLSLSNAHSLIGSQCPPAFSFYHPSCCCFTLN